MSNKRKRPHDDEEVGAVSSSSENSTSTTTVTAKSCCTATASSSVSSSTSAAKMPLSAITENQDEKNGIREPNDNDVLCGRGDRINRHPGNIYFRKLVERQKEEYSSSQFRRDKPLIAGNIVTSIQKLDPPGRFLSKDSVKGLWYEISDERAREKASQALREKTGGTRGGHSQKGNVERDEGLEAKKGSENFYPPPPWTASHAHHHAHAHTVPPPYYAAAPWGYPNYYGYGHPAPPPLAPFAAAQQQQAFPQVQYPYPPPPSYPAPSTAVSQPDSNLSSIKYERKEQDYEDPKRTVSNDSSPFIDASSKQLPTNDGISSASKNAESSPVVALEPQSLGDLLFDACTKITGIPARSPSSKAKGNPPYDNRSGTQTSKHNHNDGHSDSNAAATNVPIISNNDEQPQIKIDEFGITTPPPTIRRTKNLDYSVLIADNETASLKSPTDDPTLLGFDQSAITKSPSVVTNASDCGFFGSRDRKRRRHTLLTPNKSIFPLTPPFTRQQHECGGTEGGGSDLTGGSGSGSVQKGGLAYSPIRFPKSDNANDNTSSAHAGDGSGCTPIQHGFKTATSKLPSSTEKMKMRLVPPIFLPSLSATPSQLDEMRQATFYHNDDNDNYNVNDELVVSKSSYKADSGEELLHIDASLFEDQTLGDSGCDDWTYADKANHPPRNQTRPNVSPWRLCSTSMMRNPLLRKVHSKDTFGWELD